MPAISKNQQQKGKEEETHSIPQLLFNVHISSMPMEILTRLEKFNGSSH
uniref:Uncharacterized protein n=1 Tax=Rhizophora mucronata TaxID=61149 RepID=A0A2P2JRF5_RHIMU